MSKFCNNCFACSNRKYVTYFESVIWKCSLKYFDTYFSERWNCSPNSFNDISPVKLCCMYEIISFSTVFLPLLSFSIINPFSHMWRINCKRIIFVFIWTAISNFFSSFFAIYISANCSHNSFAASLILGLIIKWPFFNGVSNLSSNMSSVQKEIYSSGKRKVK